MSIARINMLEFDTEDDLEQRAKVYMNEAPKLFPNAEILLTIIILDFVQLTPLDLAHKFGQVDDYLL